MKIRISLNVENLRTDAVDMTSGDYSFEGEYSHEDLGLIYEKLQELLFKLPELVKKIKKEVRNND